MPFIDRLQLKVKNEPDRIVSQLGGIPTRTYTSRAIFSPHGASNDAHSQRAGQPVSRHSARRRSRAGLPTSQLMKVAAGNDAVLLFIVALLSALPFKGYFFQFFH
jgi:hypothetical protein